MTRHSLKSCECGDCQLRRLRIERDRWAKKVAACEKSHRTGNHRPNSDAEARLAKRWCEAIAEVQRVEQAIAELKAHIARKAGGVRAVAAVTPREFEAKR